MTIASATSNTSTSQTQTASANQTLNQADFLQLLVTQMSSQDPLNPQSDTAFAAQLAQFTALQQSQNMSQNMAALQANSLIGESVVVTPADGTTAVSGLVSSVLIKSGTPTVIVNGQQYNLSQIVAISPPPAATPSTPAAATNSTKP